MRFSISVLNDHLEEILGPKIRRKSLKGYQPHTNKFFILISNHRYVMTLFCKLFPIKSKITCVIMDQWDFFWEWFVFLVGNLALSVFGLFLFCFCLVWGEQVTDAQDFGLQSKEEDHFRSRFPFFFFLFSWWQFCIF